MANSMMFREYKGKNFVVKADNGRFSLGKGTPQSKRLKMDKRRFRSLSGVATAITGHPTSGKGFFGMVHGMA